jgi:hypothetical protein
MRVPALRCPVAVRTGSEIGDGGWLQLAVGKWAPRLAVGELGAEMRWVVKICFVLTRHVALEYAGRMSRERLRAALVRGNHRC